MNSLPLENDGEEVEWEISCAQVHAKREAGEEFLLLDCRENQEFELVRIDGAQLLPMSELEQRAAELEPYRGTAVVVHCHHGGRSLQVVAWLRKRGFANALSMAGGIDRWATEIDPSLSRY